MENNFIVTSKGFFKEVIVEIDKTNNVKKHNIIYVDKLRNAKAFKTETAKKVIANYEIDGFIYNPYAEEAVTNMYRVVKRSDYSIMENRSNLLQEFYVEKVKMCSETDVKFLERRKLEKEELLTFEEAKKKAILLNEELLAKLLEKIQIQLELTPERIWEQNSFR